jgi:hypothetical protein
LLIVLKLIFKNNKKAKASQSCGVVKLTPQDENERKYYIPVYQGFGDAYFVRQIVAGVV